MSSKNENECISSEFALSELDKVNVFFKRLSGINPDDVPAKYGTQVDDARKLLIENCTARAVYMRLDIEEIADDYVIIKAGSSSYTLRGKMPAKVLSDASGLFAFIVTLDGYDKTCASDIMIEYFMDTWGSAYTEALQSHIASEIGNKLNLEGMIRTHLWCPGQYTFELSNQSVLFEILKPESINCRLSDRLMMIPVKSASGIMGIVSKGTTDMLKPCDFCKFKSNCPASDHGCAVM